jgi:hypothetical protein
MPWKLKYVGGAAGHMNSFRSELLWMSILSLSFSVQGALMGGDALMGLSYWGQSNTVCLNFSWTPSTGLPSVQSYGVMSYKRPFTLVMVVGTQLKEVGVYTWPSIVIKSTAFSCHAIFLLLLMRVDWYWIGWKPGIEDFNPLGFKNPPIWISSHQV